MSCYDCASDLDFRLADLPELPAFDALWMADPRDFDVAYAINPHMLDAQGSLRRVDRERASEEWSALRRTFEELGCTVRVIPPLAGHVDLVFCANPGLPVPAAVTGEGKHWVPSRMASAERADEVEHLADFARELGWRIEPLEDGMARFEGTGDGLWHPGRQLLWGGVGPRSEAAAWEQLARRYELPVVRLELVDPDFYHLDTCLALVREDVCLWYPEAFDTRGRKLVRQLVTHTIEVSEREARRGFACNAFSPNGREVLLQRGSQDVVRALRDLDFRVIEVDTDEFTKSGGSVFCMKLAAPSE